MGVVVVRIQMKKQGCIKPPKFIFLSPPPPSKIIFFIPVTTFSSCTVGYNIWWQQWDTTFGGSCGIQIHKKTQINHKKIKKTQKITKNCAHGNSNNHFLIQYPPKIIF